MITAFMLIVAVQGVSADEEVSSSVGSATQIQGQVLAQPATTNTNVQARNQNKPKIAPKAENVMDTSTQIIKNTTGTTMSTLRRSRVAAAVQALLQVADRNGGIGKEVRVIAQNQNQNQETAENSLEANQKKGKVAKFFFGPNYKEIKKTQKLLEQNQEQVDRLTQIQGQITDQADQQKITEQIQELQKVNQETQDLLKTISKDLSLFGWIVKLFTK